MVSGVGHSGAYVYHAYQDETTFNTKPGSLNRMFGIQCKFTNVQFKENPIPLAALNQNTLAYFAYGKFEGTAPFEAVLGNMGWLSLFGGASADTGAGPWTHKYPSSGTAPPKSVTTFSLEIGDANTS